MRLFRWNLFHRRPRYATDVMGRPIGIDAEVAAEVLATGGPNRYGPARYGDVAAAYLAEGEVLLNAGMAQCVQVAERLGPGGGEGTLLITNLHVLHVLDANSRLAAAVNISDITGVRRDRIAVPNMSELTITGQTHKGEQRVSFYVGTIFCTEAVRLLDELTGYHTDSSQPRRSREEGRATASASGVTTQNGASPAGHQPSSCCSATASTASAWWRQVEPTAPLMTATAVSRL